MRKLWRCHLCRHIITRCLSSLLSVLIGAAKSADLWGAPGFFMETFVILLFAEAALAQLGERQTEDLKIPGSIPGLGIAIS